MTHKLHLTPDTLAVLFPEGSEARAELTRAVIAQFTRQYIKPNMVTAEVEKVVRTEREKAIKETLISEGVTTDTWGSISMLGSFKRKVRDEAEKEIDKVMREMLKETIEAEVSRLSLELPKIVGRTVQHMTDSAVRGLVRERRDQAVKAIG